MTALRARPEGGYELDTEGGAVRRIGRRRHRRLPAADAVTLRDAAPPEGVPAAHGGVPEPGRAPRWRRPRRRQRPVRLPGGRGPARRRQGRLPVGRCVPVGAAPPPRPRPRHWMAETGMLDQTVDTLTAPNALVACNPLSGTEGGHDCNPLDPAGPRRGQWVASQAGAARRRCSRTTSKPTSPRGSSSRPRSGSASTSTPERPEPASTEPRAASGPRARRRGPWRDHLGNGVPARLQLDRAAGLRPDRTPPAPARPHRAPRARLRRHALAAQARRRSSSASARTPSTSWRSSRPR